MKILNESNLINEKNNITSIATANHCTTNNTTYSSKQDLAINYSYVEKEKTERQANKILYIPIKVAEKLEQTLSQNPPDFNVKNYKDYLIYIIHLLYDIPARNRNIDISSSNGFVPVYKQLLKKRVDEYPKYVNYLVDNNILEKGKKHVAGLNSSQLRIKPLLVSKLAPIEITKSTLINSINRYYDVSRHYKSSTDALDTTFNVEKNYYPYLDKHFNDKLKIDVSGANTYLKLFEKEERIKICECKSKKIRIEKEISLIHKINIFKYQIDYLNNGYFYNKVDDNVGRYNSILTNIKSELRNYITYDNKKLGSVDNVSSQPYFLISLFDEKLFEKNKMDERIKHFWKHSQHEDSNINTVEEVNNNIIMIRNFISGLKNSRDVLEYKKLIASRLFYEKFAEYILMEYPNKTFKNTDSRKYAKLALLKTFFANEKIDKYSDYIPVFKKYFPSIYELFTIIKFNYKQHHLLACILQNLEAETLLKDVCGELSNNYPDIVLYTIHDSIITTEDYIDIVQQTLRTNLYNVVGEYPNFKVDYWNK